MNRGDTLITYFKYLPTRKQCGGGERKKHLVTSPIIFFFDLGSAIRAAVSFSQNTTHQKQTNKQTNKVLQATSHVCRLRSGNEPRFFWQGRSDFDLVTHNCHGKNKNITAKPKTSRQKQNTSRQNQKLHGKTKYFTAKTK